MKETRSEPAHALRSMRGSLNEPPVRKREKKVNQPVEPVGSEQYYHATVNIGVGPFNEFVKPLYDDHQDDELGGFQAHDSIRGTGGFRKKNLLFGHSRGGEDWLKHFQDYFESTKLYEKTPKAYNGEEHFDFLKKMRKVCEGIQYEAVNHELQLREVKYFEASSALQEVLYLLNSGNNVLVYGFGAKGLLLPLIVRKLIWANPNCNIYFMDYTQPFISLRKTLIRIILHLVSIIVEKKYKNNHRKFYPVFVRLVQQRSSNGAGDQELHLASNENRSKKFLSQIKLLYEKRTHHHVTPALDDQRRPKHGEADPESQKEEDQNVSQFTYSPRRLTRSSKIATVELSESTSFVSESKYSRMSSVIESSSQEEDDGDMEEDEEDELNQKNFWNTHQQPYLQQFAGELRRKVHSAGELKDVLFGVVKKEREVLQGKQVIVVNAIDVISQDDLLVGAPRVGPRLMRDEREELKVLTEIAESGFFTILGCFQDAFFPLKIGPKVNDLFVLREVHTSELERLNEQLAMLTTRVESEIKGLGYIFKSLTQYQKELLKLMANYQSDHSKPITFEKLFDISINNQLITSKKQLKEALSIPIDQKLVTQTISANQELSYQIVCSIAALEKIPKADFF